MFRKLLMTAALALGAGQASAASSTPTTYDFLAIFPSVGSFSFQFLDSDFDALVSLDEVIPGTIDPLFSSLPLILGVPTVAGFADGGSLHPTLGTPVWFFGSSTGGQTSSPASTFTYSISPVPTTVPVPATLPLAVAGLGALGLLRRRKAGRA